MATPTNATTLNISQSGSTPVAFFSQSWTIAGNPVTVYVQAGTLVDSQTGTPIVVDANGLHVIQSVGAPVSSGPISNTNIAAGGSQTLTSTVPVTTGKTGTLQHAIFASTQPTLWTIQTVNNAGTPANGPSFITDANRTFDYKPGTPGEISTVQATGTACVFQAIAQNLSTNQAVAGAAYATFFWAEN